MNDAIKTAITEQVEQLNNEWLDDYMAWKEGGFRLVSCRAWTMSQEREDGADTLDDFLADLTGNSRWMPGTGREWECRGEWYEADVRDGIWELLIEAYGGNDEDNDDEEADAQLIWWIGYAQDKLRQQGGRTMRLKDKFGKGRWELEQNQMELIYRPDRCSIRQDCRPFPTPAC